MTKRRTFDPAEARSVPPVLDREDRACATSAVDFYPEHSTGYPAAVAVCDSCPVEAECLRWALATRQSFGVMGGKTPTERDRMLRAA